MTRKKYRFHAAMATPPARVVTCPARACALLPQSTARIFTGLPGERRSAKKDVRARPGRTSKTRMAALAGGPRKGELTMSDFVFLFRGSEEQAREAMGTPERAQRSLQAWLAWIGELEAKGQLKN